MGAIKPNEYSELEKAIALGARALNHPCRVKIFALLQTHKRLNAEQLQKYLKLSKNCVREHVIKLRDAGFIEIKYDEHSYLLSINHKRYFQFCLNLERLPESL